MRVALLIAALVVLSGSSALAQATPPVVPAAPAARIIVPGSSTPIQHPTPLPIPAAESTPQVQPEFFATQGSGCTSENCDGDCHPCRRGWIYAAFFVGKAENLEYVDRRYIFGVRTGGGYWLNPERTIGLEGNFFDAHGSYRETLAGPMSVNSPVTLFTADANLRAELLAHDRYRVDGLVGYRYVQDHEKFFASTDVSATDLSTRSHIHAVQVGAVGSYRYGAYFAEVIAKIGLGQTSVDSDVNGVRTIHHDRSFVSEVGARVGYQLGESLWAMLGYRSIYLSNIDRPTRPNTDYFLHGLVIGCEKRF